MVRDNLNSLQGKSLKFTNYVEKSSEFAHLSFELDLGMASAFALGTRTFIIEFISMKN